jgi:NAD(P)-dependent dehydrogenase (short-subunit alcohol dehydrogenase family)
MAPERPSYGLTKNASTLLVQQIAKDTAPEDLQIVSFHPGGVLTEAARKQGYDEDSGIRHDDGKCSFSPMFCCAEITVSPLPVVKTWRVIPADQNYPF